MGKSITRGVETQGPIRTCNALDGHTLRAAGDGLQWARGGVPPHTPHLCQAAHGVQHRYAAMPLLAHLPAAKPALVQSKVAGRPGKVHLQAEGVEPNCRCWGR